MKPDASDKRRRRQDVTTTNLVHTTQVIRHYYLAPTDIRQTVDNVKRNELLSIGGDTGYAESSIPTCECELGYGKHTVPGIRPDQIIIIIVIFICSDNTTNEAQQRANDKT